ncbi:MAG: DUF1456 family protein [Gammaproteobacteria bacterium]|nr:DUF1456 family protein [Gammaproteobacteria bacterium]
METSFVLRSIRYALDLPDHQVAALLQQGGKGITVAEVNQLLLREDDPHFQLCSEAQLIAFLNGLILKRRGPQSPSQGRPTVEKELLTNNLVLKKLRVAFELRDEDMQNLLTQGGITLAKAELSALFRHPDHKNYRQCGDQVLRKFLKGLSLKLRPEAAAKARQTPNGVQSEDEQISHC